ncbi:MaoC/PaaZ C-terminal domain-containing protein [Microbacterium sp. p3-SID336]|uniref:MaoC/PaaZ C-terminal domain-containing protein n=1 Tax=Microbacterium sp. p3-SID336 TaxID=2916212 RepID=UPI0021A30B57|nr:MaoC/PaaZ C-terminal domain-containing protein [Microbacterium sp. p3-SID336]MCT1479917.1 dehydratase [Microbacterium sp. p3-SID336]
MTRLTVEQHVPSLTIAPLTRTTLALFAGASGDHNPIHIDLDAARAAGLEDVFAHGMLSMAYLGRMLTGFIPQRALRDFSVRFAAITPLYAQPRCTGVVTAVDDREATLAIQVTLPDGTVTLRGEAVIDITALHE